MRTWWITLTRGTATTRGPCSSSMTVPSNTASTAARAMRQGRLWSSFRQAWPTTDPAPGVPGFCKRELYLDETFLPGGLTGAAIDQTAIVDPPLRAALAGLHDRLLLHPRDSLGVQAGLTLVGERITSRLAGVQRPPGFPDARVARRLRELLDAHITGPMSLESAAAALGRSVPHLVRSFTREFGLSPPRT
jgi:hypothetical protein